MASGTKVKKHKCSCGRSFRHAISLKRHQNVTGCEANAPEAEASADATEATKEKTDAAAATPTPTKVDDDRTIVITPELVAAWQQQTGFNKRPQALVDTIPVKPAEPKVDWVALAQTTKAFAEFCGEVKNGCVSAAKSALFVLGRSALFLSVVCFAGWLLVTGVSASDNANQLDNYGKSQLAAQTVVQDFLQNARLNQYQRARRLLIPSAQQSVSASQLQVMFNSLPLNQQPSGWKTELSADGRNAWVTIARGGVNEVYTLTNCETGWGLASVSIANS